jgi:hypothetical protein
VDPIALEQDQEPVELAQVLVELSQDLVAVHLEVDSHQGDQLEVAVAVLAAELLERSVRVAQEDRARLVSPSVPSVKNLNKEVSRA